MQFKRGNTLELAGTVTVTGSAGAVSDLTGWTGTVSVRDHSGNLISNPTFTWLNAATRLVKIRQESAVTLTWPLTTLHIDIRFTAPNGDVVNTSTAHIEVVEAITHA